MQDDMGSPGPEGLDLAVAGDACQRPGLPTSTTSAEGDLVPPTGAVAQLTACG